MVYSIKCSIDDPYMNSFSICWVELPTIYSVDKFLTEFIYYDFTPDQIDQSNYSDGQKYVVVLLEWTWRVGKALGVIMVFAKYLTDRDLKVEP
jgi:hypothetical protein